MIKEPAPHSSAFFWLAVWLLCALPATGTHAFSPAEAVSASPSNQSSMNHLPLEELMEVEITVAAKKPQKLLKVASAVTVLSSEDIRRSGASSIPELLRLVPGLQVARINSSTWAISSRGFNSDFSNKLLVLVDGRTVYTPDFAGVYWDTQDTLLEDIERIEVIRGPGASVWGSNAVNGVINIVTRTARDSRGALLSAGGGFGEETYFGSFRYGGQTGNSLFYRVYAKSFEKDDFEGLAEQNPRDHWKMHRGGFRLDTALEAPSRVSLMGEFYKGEASQAYQIPTLAPPYAATQRSTTDLKGAHLVGRWEHARSADNTFSIHTSFDVSRRHDILLKSCRNTFDFEFQHRFALGKRQDIQWGAGYRHSRDRQEGSFVLTLLPENDNYQLYSAFLQNEIRLYDTLNLTLGCRFEHNDYTGLEVLPNARAIWAVTPRHSVWAAVSRAVRTPSRTDIGLRVHAALFPTGPDSLSAMTIQGNRSVGEEKLTAWEIGTRSQLTEHLSVETALFYNDYDELVFLEAGSPRLDPDPPPGHMDIPLVFNNNTEGHSYGLEISSNWAPVEWWRWSAGYSYLKIRLNSKTGDSLAAAEQAEGESPRHQASLRSQLNLPYQVELDAAWLYVDNLKAQKVPSYTRFDVRLGWKPTPKVELVLAGQNLLDDSHPEFNGNEGYITASEIPRSLYAKATWRY